LAQTAHRHTRTVNMHQHTLNNFTVSSANCDYNSSADSLCSMIQVITWMTATFHVRSNVTWEQNNQQTVINQVLTQWKIPCSH